MLELVVVSDFLSSSLTCFAQKDVFEFLLSSKSRSLPNSSQEPLKDLKMNSLFFCGGVETPMINTASIHSALLKLLVVLLFPPTTKRFTDLSS